MCISVCVCVCACISVCVYMVCVCVHVYMCLCACVCMCVVCLCMCVHVLCVCVRVWCVCVCESPLKGYLTNDYNFKVSFVHYLEKRYIQLLSVHLINNICEHVLIFLWLLLNYTVVS